MNKWYGGCYSGWVKVSGWFGGHGMACWINCWIERYLVDVLVDRMRLDGCTDG